MSRIEIDAVFMLPDSVVNAHLAEIVALSIERQIPVSGPSAIQVEGGAIGLIVDGAPVLGVVHAPALDLTFTGHSGAGATVARDGGPASSISVRPSPASGVTIVASRRHGDPEAIDKLLRGHPVADRKTAGSSLKFCLVAEGEADIYPRFGRTMEWDTAAGQAVLTAAGGHVTDEHGAPFTYGKPGFENPPFIAWGGMQPWA